MRDSCGSIFGTASYARYSEASELESDGTYSSMNTVKYIEIPFPHRVAVWRCVLFPGYFLVTCRVSVWSWMFPRSFFTPINDNIHQTKYRSIPTNCFQVSSLTELSFQHPLRISAALPNLDHLFECIFLEWILESFGVVTV